MAQQYQVLARKWRPQQFDDVVGQEHITTTLKNAIEQQRLAHAYLFVGPRGIGKTSTARIFAKALNCTHAQGPTTTPCNDPDQSKWCDNCREITNGTALDVLEIDGASNNGVEQVRELRDTCRYAPARGRFKIYLIDEVHMLTTQAFNALLKTLEEPPEHVKFFFATTEPQKVLATILSRCQRFDLRRIPASLIVKHLQEIAKGENIKVEPEALAAIARGAEGGMRDAESTLDQLIAFCGEKITEADVLSVFGLVAHDKIAALTNAVIDGDANATLGIVQELDHVGKDLQRLLADLLDHFRNLLVVTLGAADAALDLPDTELALLKTQAPRIDADAVLRIIDALAAAEGRLRYALSKRVLLEIALIKAIKARQMVGLEGVLKKLNELKAQLPAGGGSGGSASAGSPAATAPAAAARVAETSPSTPLSALSVEQAWADAVEHLGKVAPFAKNYLVGAKLLCQTGNTLVIGFDPQFAAGREFLDNARNREVLQTRLKQTLHRDVALKFELSDAAAPEPIRAAPTAIPRPAAVAAAPARPVPPAPPKQSPDEFKNDPLIKKALEIFKATIVDVRT